MIALFSYGSNGTAQLQERLGRRVKTARAFALGWRRIYRGWSDKWNGGVASLKKKSGSAVYGSVAFVTSDDLNRLDRYEGVLSGSYKRSKITVQTDKGEIKAVVYIATSNEWNKPSQRYLKATARNVGEHWRNSDGSKPSPSDFYNEE